MANEGNFVVDPDVSFQGSPYDSSDRDGKVAPAGPADPVAVWERARTNRGINGRMATESEVEEITIEYIDLCKKIKQIGEITVVGQVSELPDDVNKRWEWHKSIVSADPPPKPRTSIETVQTDEFL